MIDPDIAVQAIEAHPYTVWVCTRLHYILKHHTRGRYVVKCLVTQHQVRHEKEHGPSDSRVLLEVLRSIGCEVESTGEKFICYLQEAQACPELRVFLSLRQDPTVPHWKTWPHED